MKSYLLLLCLYSFLPCFIFTALSKAAGGPVAEFYQDSIELGVIPEDFDDILGPVTISNKGTADLKILNVTGPCSCFKGYEGDKVIKPGKDGNVLVIFDKSKIEAGKVTRTANITTNDPANKELKVKFTFTVERDKDSEELRALRSEITNLRKELHMLRRDIRVLANALKGTAKPAAKAPTKRKPDTTVYDIEIGESPVLGSKDAPVTITEFVDLQCPYCVREYPKIQEIVKDYGDKVKVVFKHYPLSFHAKAKPAHAAVEFALQEKGSDAFWKMHDMIMAQPKKLDISVLRGYAEKLGLNLDKFDKIMADKKAINKMLADDKALARKCKVRGTPTIMINGLKLTDRSIEAYKKRIDKILSKSAKPKAVTKK